MRDLLYPLGYAASFFFGIRFYIQWYLSEKRKAIYSGPIFWNLSILAHALLTIHGYIQMQYGLMIIQILNGVICWRNLELIRKKGSMKRTLVVMGVTTFIATLGFIAQAPFTNTFSWTGGEHFVPLSGAWHLFGFVGMSFFASRFWIQWLQSEKSQVSVLSSSFFWISLIGSLACLIYFVRLWDLVNILGYGFGMSLYVRNLILIRRKKA